MAPFPPPAGGGAPTKKHRGKLSLCLRARWGDKLVALLLVRLLILNVQKLNTWAARHAGVCLLCAIVGWILSAPFGPSEFSGGTMTGPLLAIHDISGYLFLLAVVMTFVYPRFAAGVAIVACVLSLPLYL